MRLYGWKLAASGSVLWMLGTIFFYFRASQTFERGPTLYVTNVIVTVLVYVFSFWLLARAFKAPRSDWGSAALWFVLPGMLGEIPVLLAFPSTLPTLAPVSAAAYAAFLFCGYVAVGLFALAVSLRAQRGNS